MGRISDLSAFNNNRRDLMKIKTLSDETILFTKEEAKAALISYIDKELDLFATEITDNRKDKLESRINFKMKQIESSLIDLINERIDAITERVISITIDRIAEEEINKRVEQKLNK